MQKCILHDGVHITRLAGARASSCQLALEHCIIILQPKHISTSPKDLLRRKRPRVPEKKACRRRYFTRFMREGSPVLGVVEEMQKSCGNLGSEGRGRFRFVPFWIGGD
jgi:hypothetical protein